jgi:hypothetical protein
MKKTPITLTRQRRAFSSIPIAYHPDLEEHFDEWAAACRIPPAKLRYLSEVAIKRRHHQAGRTHEFYFMTREEFESAPYRLHLGGSVGRVYVYYFPKGDTYLIQGYGWTFYDAYGYQESDDELGVGGFYR